MINISKTICYYFYYVWYDFTVFWYISIILSCLIIWWGQGGVKFKVIPRKLTIINIFIILHTHIFLNVHKKCNMMDTQTYIYIKWMVTVMFIYCMYSPCSISSAHEYIYIFAVGMFCVHVDIMFDNFEILFDLFLKF